MRYAQNIQDANNDAAKKDGGIVAGTYIKPI